MTSYQMEHFWSEIKDLEARIPEGKLEYLRERLRNDLYDFILRKFLEERKSRGMSKAKLARRLGCDPARLNRLLGAPGNWTLATVSDLLVGISGETLSPKSDKVPGSLLRNQTANDLLWSSDANFGAADHTVTGSGSNTVTGSGSNTKVMLIQ